MIGAGCIKKQGASHSLKSLISYLVNRYDRNMAVIGQFGSVGGLEKIGEE